MAKRETAKTKWFIKVRGSYLPATWQAWLSYIPFIAYLVGCIWWTKSQTSSTIFLVYLVVIQWLVAAGLMTWLAKRTS